MSREVEAQSGAIAAADNTNPNPDPGTPVVDYEAQAAQLRTILEAMPEKVPYWQWFHPVAAQALRGGRLVPEAFITSVSDGVAGAASLRTLNTFDVEDTGDRQRYKLAYQPIADLFLRMGRSLQFSIDARKASAGLKALQTYYRAKGLGRTVAGADARDAALKMRQALGRKGRGNKKKEVPQPQPAPEQPPAPKPLPMAA